MNLENRIKAFADLGEKISHYTFEDEISVAIAKNNWFTETNVRFALDAIASQMLNIENLGNWLENYKGLDQVIEKEVALILAGNIPAVGFHDVLCVLILGHRAQIKLSSKDDVLIPFLLKKLVEINPAFQSKIKFVERVAGFDAIIATGSNNSSIYFNHYFEKYPHIIRKNRKSVAIIFKDSSDEMIRKLGNDIFMHFGLGCRNVSKIFVEKGVDLSHIMEVLHENKTLILHNKYKNNYDYNYTIYLLNKEDFLMNGALLLRRNESIHSRISTVHYEEFITEGELLAKISSHSEDLQCLVSEKPIKNFDVIQPGMTQRPSLMDYADHVDTISFLQNI